VISGRRGELPATGLFVLTAVAVAVLVGFVPHTTRKPAIPYSAVNGTVGMDWFFLHPNARPARGASTYGLSSPPVAASAGATYSVTDSVRSTRAPGGTVCLALRAVTADPSTPPQTAHACAPLTAGWSRLPTVTLVPSAPSRVYAQITALGNDGGFEARALNVSSAR
jgi:hypothetical protein